MQVQVSHIEIVSSTYVNNQNVQVPFTYGRIFFKRINKALAGLNIAGISGLFSSQDEMYVCRDENFLTGVFGQCQRTQDPTNANVQVISNASLQAALTAGTITEHHMALFTDIPNAYDMAVINYPVDGDYIRQKNGQDVMRKDGSLVRTSDDGNTLSLPMLRMWDDAQGRFIGGDDADVKKQAAFVLRRYYKPANAADNGVQAPTAPQAPVAPQSPLQQASAPQAPVMPQAQP